MGEEELLRYLSELGERMRRGDADAFFTFVAILEKLIQSRSVIAGVPGELALADWVTRVAIAAGRPDGGSLPALMNGFLNDLDHAFIELRRVSDLQTRITKASLPVDCGIELGIASRAKLWMTGDFVDSANRGEWTWLILGDASTHGPAAAYYANTVFPVLRVYLSFVDSLSEAVRRANQSLHQYRPGVEYSVVQVVAWNRSTRELQVVNAGLTVRPIIISGGIAKCIDVAGPALAWGPDAVYDVSTFQMSPGDAIVLASDGIKDQEDGSEAAYGEERLCCFVQRHVGFEPNALAQSIMGDVDVFSSGVVDDDQTVVVARFR